MKKPIGDRVILVNVRPLMKQTAAGLVLPENVENMMVGEVSAVGPDCKQALPLDWIIFERKAGLLVMSKGEPYTVIVEGSGILILDESEIQ